VRRFDVTLDHVDEELLARTRAIRDFENVAVVSQADGVKMTVTVQASDSSLEDLMRALTANGQVLRDFRPVESDPVDVFNRVVRVAVDD